MEYQDRVNRPLGMSDVDLLIYDKDIYTMYRTNEGLETDAFRYDPVVSAGMLASDYAFAEGMQWVNLLTPASQDKVNPGDGLIVPVQTYDNYKNLPPIEKYLTHEVSYTANQLNIVRDESLHNEFVGDFNNYFDGESGFTRGTMPIETPIPVRPPIGSLFNPVRPPIRPTLFENAPPKPIKKPNFNDVSGNINQVKAKLAACIRYYAKPVMVKNKFGKTERRIMMPSSIDPCKKLRDRLKILLAQQTALVNAQPTAPTSEQVQAVTQTQNLITASTPSPTPASGGEVISGGFMGGGGVSMGGGGEISQPEAQPESQPEVQAEAPAPSQAKVVEKKVEYMPIIVGAVVCTVIGYFYASKSNKSVKMFSIAGAIVGGIIGYLYSTTKLSKSESKYFVDDFYR